MYSVQKDHHSPVRPFALKKIRSDRKTVEIRINAEAKVTVYIPNRMAEKEADRFVDFHHEKILKAIEKMKAKPEFEQLTQNNRIYVKGASLTVRARLGLQNAAVFSEEFADVTVTGRSLSFAQKALYAAFIREAKLYFSERFSVIGEQAKTFGLQTEYPFILKDLKGKWGSCHSNGKITLNAKLFGAAPDRIDYVIAHEFCHLKEMNHSHRFYDLLSRLYPRYKSARAELKTVSPLLLRPINLTEEIFTL